MRIKKSSGLIALICTLISISWLFFKKELTLSTISDALFLWALFFLIIGGFGSLPLGSLIISNIQ